MRPAMMSLALAIALSAAAPALAAPTCQDRKGDTIRCGVPGAMPVGWSLPDDQRPLVPLSSPMPLTTLLGLMCGIGGLFVLIALMPQFDGWREGDWGKQEGDDDR